MDVTKKKLPFKNKFFDKIVMCNVLEHLDTPMFALKEIRRVLKDTGKLIIVVPNCDNIIKVFASIIYEKKYIYEYKLEHPIGFGTEEICALVKRANFKIISLKKHNPEIVTFKIIFPEWRIFKPIMSELWIIVEKGVQKQ